MGGDSTPFLSHYQITLTKIDIFTQKLFENAKQCIYGEFVPTT